MSAPAKCPQCATKLQPDWESCPNCPMSFQDAPPQKGALQSDNFRNFGMPILFFGGLAYFIWAAGQYMWRTAEEGAKTVVAVPKPAGPPAIIKADAVGAAPMPETSKPEEEEGPSIVSVMSEKSGFAAKTPKAVFEWKMRGVIYDLVTLKPIPGVHMIFTDYATNSRAQILTDAQGRYRAILPALPGRGYLVSLSKAGYHKSYLDPGTEGVAEMPLERRSEIVGELSSLIAEPASLQPNSDTPLVTDFHMAPK